MSRVLVGDRYGKVLTEIEPYILETTWELSGMDTAQFEISTQDAKATQENLHVGNKLIVLYDNGLPDWGGFIEQPREWTPGKIRFKCYGPEYRYRTRYTAKRDPFPLMRVGEMFKRLLEREEQKDPMGITIGNVWIGGEAHTKVFHFRSVWDLIDYELPQLQQFEYIFTSFVEDNEIQFQADFYQLAGSDKTRTVILHEGRNARVERFVEQGELINQHYAVEGGSDWSEDRNVRLARVENSIAAYGLRETAEIYGGTNLQASLVMNAQKIVEDRSVPKVLFSLFATDDEPGEFSDYRLGDEVRCVLPSYSFGGYDEGARIKAMTYRPQTGENELILEEPEDVEYYISFEEDDLNG